MLLPPFIFLLFFITYALADGKASSPELTKRLDGFITKVFDGAVLTVEHTLSRGRDYVSIDQDVTFWCIKPQRKELKKTLHNDPDINSKIDFSKKVNFVIHGWLGGLHDGNMHSPRTDRSNQGWMQPLAVDWAFYANCNVCAVDWSRLANFAYSKAALDHTKIVSAAVVRFIRFLTTRRMKIGQVSIAGHSLGAHIAGLVGASFKGRINAIYGLDAAGPGFTFPFDIGPKNRLDPTDARYVQCIYTSRGTLGTMADCGHGNFIMNDGMSQPGCITPLCSHSKATEYFKDSLNPNNRLKSKECESGKNQMCSDIMDRPGIHSDRKHGKFYIDTGSALLSVPNNNNRSATHRPHENQLKRIKRNRSRSQTKLG